MKPLTVWFIIYKYTCYSVNLIPTVTLNIGTNFPPTELSIRNKFNSSSEFGTNFHQNTESGVEKNSSPLLISNIGRTIFFQSTESSKGTDFLPITKGVTDFPIQTELNGLLHTTESGLGKVQTIKNTLGTYLMLSTKSYSGENSKYTSRSSLQFTNYENIYQTYLDVTKTEFINTIKPDKLFHSTIPTTGASLQTGIDVILKPLVPTVHSFLCPKYKINFKGECIKFQCSYGFMITNDSVCARIQKDVDLNKSMFETKELYIYLSVSTSIFIQKETKKLSRFVTKNTVEKNVLHITKSDEMSFKEFFNVFYDLKSSSEILGMYFVQKKAIFSNIMTLLPQQTFMNNSICAQMDTYSIHLSGAIKLKNNVLCAKLTGVSNQVYDNSILCFSQSNPTVYLYKIIKSKKFSKILYRDDYNLWKFCTNSYIVYKFGICQQFFHTVNQSCPMIYLNETYHILKNLTVFINKTNETIDIDSYIPLSYGIATCSLNKILKANSWNVADEVKSKVTLYGLILSCVFLLWLIFIHIRFKSLHNVAGYNLTAVCISFICADVFFLCSVYLKWKSTSCILVAISLHWFLLNAYLWAFIVSFDMLTTFYSMKSGLRNQRSFRRTFNYFIFVCISSVFILVLPQIIPKYRNMYGGNVGVCWINDQKGSLYFFNIPILSLLSCSAILLLITLINMRRQRTEVSDSIKTTVNTPKLAFKLVFLLGLVEILGFVQINNESNIHWRQIVNESTQFIYVIFRSFRGVLMFLVIISSKNIIKLHHKISRRIVKMLSVNSRITSSTN